MANEKRQPETEPLDRLAIRRLALEAGVVEVTLRKRLRGESVRGVAGDRCDRVLRAHGFEPGILREAS